MCLGMTNQTGGVKSCKLNRKPLPPLTRSPKVKSAMMSLFCACLILLAALGPVVAQTNTKLQPLPTLPPPAPAGDTGAPQGGDLSWDNFNYTAGNTYALAGPSAESDGLNKGQVAGIVVGCVLAGVLLGSLATLCWLKRRRLFPERYGPPKHPDEAAPVSPIDVLHTGSKLDKMTKQELVSPKSFSNRHHTDKGNVHSNAV